MLTDYIVCTLTDPKALTDYIVCLYVRQPHRVNYRQPHRVNYCTMTITIHVLRERRI